MRLVTMFIILVLSFSLVIAGNNYSIKEKNGIKEVSNKNKASIESLKIEPTEIFSIEVLDSDNDKHGN
jgi:Tfp pilus assembly protein PilX